MAIDFPDSPSNGDIHTVSGKRWQWDGEKWQAYGASLAPDVLYVDQGNARVGINNTTPSVPLHVASGSSGATAHSYTGLIVESDERAAISILTPTNMDGYIYFGDPEGNNVGRITYGHGSNVFVFTTNGYDRMAIDGSGNVGIGDTSPDSKLHIANGDIRISGGTSGNSNKIIFIIN